MSLAVHQEIVAEWNRRAGNPAPSHPTLISAEEVDLQVAMLEEEIREYRDAALDGDLVGVADALADTLFVLLGATSRHGIDLEPILDIVEDSNWSKFDENGQPVPHPTIPGKIGKSEFFEAPEPAIAREILRQKVREDD